MINVLTKTVDASNFVGITEFEAGDKFDPYLPWIRECWWAGWNDYKERFSHPWDDNRARATMIQNRAVIHARSTHSQFPEIKFKEFNSRRLFLFGDWAVLQYKKLTHFEGQLRLSNNLNRAVEAFDSQEPVLGLCDAPRFTVGYLPNEFHTDMSIHLVFTKSHFANNWTIDISGKPVAVNMDFFEATDEQVSRPTKRVRIRGQQPTSQSDDDTAQG